MKPSIFRKLLRFWRKYIHCNHRFFKVHSIHCYKCKRKIRLTDDEYWSKILKIQQKKNRWHSY
jgi:hypothetical protein